jgi:hypothetical protein
LANLFYRGPCVCMKAATSLFKRAPEYIKVVFLGLSCTSDLCIVAANVAEQSRKKSQKVAEGRESLRNKEQRCHVNQSFIVSLAMILIKSQAQHCKAKSRKVAEGCTKSRNIACNCSDLQVQDTNRVKTFLQ